ncbi:MAG: hypothetical protein LBJ17_09335 [Dysgonamonadaceae bacterium]|jgi:hypothetical protein|nr:hypothetical protein [Dysgonamonadaceae bacterium]
MNISKALSKKLKISIPKTTKTVHLIADLLGITKVSAYRRLSGNTPFQLEEACLLSRRFNISLDELLKEERIIEDTDIIALDNYHQFLETLTDTNPGITMITANSIRLALAMEYPKLFNFILFRSAHRHSPTMTDLFSEYEIPEKLEHLRRSIVSLTPENSLYEYIISQHLFSRIVSDVNYFRQSRQLTREDAAAIRENLVQLLKKMELQMNTGKDESGNSHIYYLSTLDMESNTLTVESCNLTFHLVWSSTCEPYSLTSNNTLYYRQWFDNLKKYTSSISLLNEIQRMDFLDRQLEYLESI